MKSQRMRLAMRGTVIFGHVEKLAFAFSYLRRRRKCMTVVGDTLSAARDIETSARMMCMVTAVRDCAAST
jgi:hypothetical protein